jgi:hypothetical protein
VLSVKELRSLSARLSPEQLRKQLGPFVLVQQPPDLGFSTPRTEMMGSLPVNVRETKMVAPEKVSAGALGLLFQFDDLVVATVPPLKDDDELTVGRQPDNDLVLDHSSVSKRHAVLRWDEAHQRCTVKDLGSTNGTHLNASTRLHNEITLKSGDILSFGDVGYWYLTTEQLHARLKNSSRGVNV